MINTKGEWIYTSAEIAYELGISPSTVNAIVKRLFGKRQAAIDALADYIHNVDKVIGTGRLSPNDCKDAATSVIAGLPSAQPEQRWIPCSERLPEEDDYKSCIECLDGAVWYFTENGTMGIGYYYESTKEWSTTYDLKTDGKVVAWMPLPEPYKERRAENADVNT